MLVFLKMQGDKLYTVSNWPEYLQDQLEEDVDEKNINELNYDEEISHALNTLEKI